jgi:hypothetical protein
MEHFQTLGLVRRTWSITSKPGSFSSAVEKNTDGCPSLNTVSNSFLGFSYSYPARVTCTLDESIRLRN